MLQVNETNDIIAKADGEKRAGKEALKKASKKEKGGRKEWGKQNLKERNHT